MRPFENYKFLQYKFIIRALNNQYFSKFFQESMHLNTRTSIIGNLKSSIRLRNNDTTETIQYKLMEEILDIKIRVKDRFKYNPESQIVAKIFETKNFELRKMRLLSKLYYANK